MSARQNRGDSGAHRAFTDFERTLTTNQSGVANFDASDIGDRVKFPGRALKWNSKIACANNFIFNDGCGWQMLLRFARGRLEHDYEHEEEEHETREAFRFHPRSINYQLPTINFSA